MTQLQLDSQVARVTGEPLAMVHFWGFSLVLDRNDDLEPEDLKLVLDCPFCGRCTPYPGPTENGAETMAECHRCDIYFAFPPEEIYAIPADQPIGYPAE